MKILHLSIITGIVIMAGITVFVFIDQQPNLTISTDKKVYDKYGDGVEVYGIVKPSVEGRSLFFTVVEPNGTSYHIDSSGNFHDGKYDAVFSIGMPNWHEKGTYKIVAHYGDLTAETSVEFIP